MRATEIAISSGPRSGVRVPELPAPDGDPRGLLTRLKSSCLRTMELAREWDADTTKADLLWEIAATLLPDLPPEQLALLTVPTIIELMQLANQPREHLVAYAEQQNKASTVTTTLGTAKRRAPRKRSA